MALYILKEINPATGRPFRDDDTTSYYADDDFDGDAFPAATAGYNMRVAQDDLNWGPGSGAKRWTLFTVSPKAD
ncbi:hypothetical protein [Streptomyces sp. NPDC018059]|uniref:hypothetical protein n=1 Tax=Streptomyces sp. NPDC018059 TaxID=3365041 RepID=UPI0037873C8B